MIHVLITAKMARGREITKRNYCSGGDLKWNSLLSVVSKDMKGASIPDAMVMVEDRVQWKRDVAAHATPQECMLRE